MAASVNEAEFAARKRDEVCKTVLSGTTSVFFFFASTATCTMCRRNLQPSRFGSRKLGLDQSS
jgi:hypothetical protein